jgi:ABC-2 type transport system ATP-binding protein
MTLAIETNGLTKSFGTFTAVDGIDLRVEQGTINGFIGPNGAGKTTTMKVLIGALHPNGGSGKIKGHPLGSMEAKKLLGFSPEHPKFYEEMTGHDYLVYMGMICGMNRHEAYNRGMELLKWLDIAGFSDKKIHGYSAGMRQKLSLAQSLIHEPEILILDEPTANLDPAGRLSIIKKLKELCQENNTTVFISSHVLGELEKLVTDVTN